MNINKKTYERKIVSRIVKRMEEPRQFIQVLVGSRQTGKSTALDQASKKLSIPVLSVEADATCTCDWIKAKWYQARNIISSNSKAALLIIDEVQYVEQWSNVVKLLWDEDAKNGIDLRVVLSGSSAMLLQSGLAESLMGRFEVIHCPHWSYSECNEAFGFSLDDFLIYGGYPGAAPLKNNYKRWKNYITQSIIEPCITNDVLALEPVRNPALLRRLFYLGASYSGQEISYRKLLGQLNDKGNTATIAHYLELLGAAGLLCGVQKYNSKIIRSRASSPRMMVYNTALMSAVSSINSQQLSNNPDIRGHLVESAVGAYLLNRAKEEGFEVYWWRDGDKEVDFVLSTPTALTAIEVKSGRVKNTKGMTNFLVNNPHAKSLIVGSPELSISDFLLGKVELFF